MLETGHLIRIAGRVYDTPLLIAPTKLSDIMAFLAPRIADDGPSISAVTPFQANDSTRHISAIPEGVGVVRIHGTTVHRTRGFEAASGVMSYENIRAQFAEAMNDPAIRVVLLDVDSSGGEAAGVFDLSDEIYSARGLKPIVAYVNDRALSAGYAIASAADEVYMPKTGAVGSIGVIAIHRDQTKADEKAGFTYTTVFAGSRKNDLNPHQPISAEAVEILQNRVNGLYSTFVETVARNRGVAPEAIRGMEAAIYFGPEATPLLADKLVRRSELMGHLQKLSGNVGGVFMSVEAGEKTAGTEAPVESKVVDIEEIRKKARAEAVEAERARVSGIRELCRTVEHLLPEGFAQSVVDSGCSTEDAPRQILAAMAKKTDETPINSASPVPTKPQVNPLLADAKRRAGIKE